MTCIFLLHWLVNQVLCISHNWANGGDTRGAGEQVRGNGTTDSDVVEKLDGSTLFLARITQDISRLSQIAGTAIPARLIPSRTLLGDYTILPLLLIRLPLLWLQISATDNIFPLITNFQCL